MIAKINLYIFTWVYNEQFIFFSYLPTEHAAWIFFLLLFAAFVNDKENWEKSNVNLIVQLWECIKTNRVSNGSAVRDHRQADLEWFDYLNHQRTEKMTGPQRTACFTKGMHIYTFSL